MSQRPPRCSFNRRADYDDLRQGMAHAREALIAADAGACFSPAALRPYTSTWLVHWISQR